MVVTMVGLMDETKAGLMAASMVVKMVGLMAELMVGLMVDLKESEKS
jgi:hypothetical protein